MHIRHLVVVGAAASVALASALPAAAEAEPAPCAVTEVVGIDQLGHPTDDAGEVTAVVATLTGDLPIDVASTVGEAVGSAMGATGRVWTTMRSTRDGAEATVSPVAGPLPDGLDQLVEDALGCGEVVVSTIEPSTGDDADGQPDSDASGPSDALPVAGSASAECQVTSVLPVDAAGTVTTTASEVEGAVVAVTGPLPVGVADTVASVIKTATDAAGPLAVTVVETVDTVEVTVTGAAGPLPADLSTTLAGALGCKDSAAPADPTDPGGSSDPTGSDDPLPSDSTDGPTSGDTSVAGEQIHRSGGFLPTTGGPIGISLVAGSALVGAGGLARGLRRLVAAREDLRLGA